MNISLPPKHHSVTVVVVKIGIALIPIVVLLSLLNKNFVLTAHQSYHYSAGQISGIIMPTTKLVRTANPRVPWQIMADEMPLTVHIPRLVQDIAVTATLRNNDAPAVYLTAEGQTKVGEISILADAPQLNALNWHRSIIGDVTFWQRPSRIDPTNKNNITPIRQYTSLEDVQNNPPSATAIAVVGVDRMSLARVAKYQASTQPLTTAHTFRGKHQLYVYAANEDLHISFSVIDFNRVKSKSTLQVNVSQVDGLSTPPVIIHHQSLADDGVTNGRGKTGPIRSVNVIVPAVSAGVYLIDVIASDDLAFSNLTSWQHNLSFNGRLYLAEGPSYVPGSKFSTATVLTNGTTFSVSADHDAGKQTVTFAGQKLSITTVRHSVSATRLKGTNSVTITKPDVVVTSDGLVTLTPFTILPAGATPLSLFPTPPLDQFDYIIAKYVPHQTKDTLVVTGTFPMDTLKLSGPEGKLLTFRIDTPGLQANNYEVGLTSIKATLIRGPFPWDKIKQKLNGLMH